MAALLSLAACQNEEMRPLDFRTDPDAVRINASVGDMITRSNPTAETATGFNQGDIIAIKTNQQPNFAEYTFDGSGLWEHTGGNYLTWTADELTFEAVYPASAKNGFSLPDDQSSPEKIALADYMTVKDKTFKAADGKTISLTMERQTARIIIEKIEWNDQYLAADGTTPTHTLENLTIHDKATDKAVTPYREETSGKYYALLMPTSTAGTAETTADGFITLIIADADGAETTLTVKANPTLEAARSYTYTLYIGKDKANIGSVMVSDWNGNNNILGEGVVGDTQELTYSVSTSDDGRNTYTVYSSKGLQEVNQLVLNDLSANITLAQDIYLPTVEEGESNWTPIGTRETPYTGTFNGNEKNIYNLTINSNQESVGFFGCLSGEVKNLHIMLAKISSSNTQSDVGGIIGLVMNDGVISGSSVGASTIFGQSVGGIVGRGKSGAGTISDCQVNSLDLSGEMIGGIAGVDVIKIQQCLVENSTLTVNEIVNGGIKSLGGILGHIALDKSTSITECDVYGNTFSNTYNEHTDIYVGLISGTVTQENNTATNNYLNGTQIPEGDDSTTPPEDNQ